MTRYAKAAETVREMMTKMAIVASVRTRALVLGPHSVPSDPLAAPAAALGRGLPHFMTVPLHTYFTLRQSAFVARLSTGVGKTPPQT